MRLEDNKNKKTQKRNIWKVGVLQRKRLFVLAFLVFLGWFGFSSADINNLNLFEDNDGDGLTNEEELMYGTDPDNKDSDSDGYSDLVEIESGYDPLKAAPGDQVIQVAGESDKNDDESKENQEHKASNEENLTQEVINKLLESSGEEFKNLSEIYNNPEDFDTNKLQNNSLSSEEIAEAVEEATDQQFSQKTIELIPEDEIKVKEKPSGSEKEIKEKEKEQINEYTAAILYIFALHKPFRVSNNSDLTNQSVAFIENLYSQIQTDDIESIKELKQSSESVYEEVIEIEAPYVLKDIHQRALSVNKFLVNTIDEQKLVENNDPLALAFYVGNLQSALVEFEDIRNDMSQLLEEYEIEEFDLNNIVSSMESDEK